MPAKKAKKKPASGGGGKAAGRKSGAKSSAKGAKRRAAPKRPAPKRRPEAAPGEIGLAPSGVLLVNMIPRSLSGETHQDSEPHLTVNPANPQQIVGTAFTPDPGGGPNAPIFVSNDGGNTWLLNSIVPSVKLWNL